MIVKRLFPVGPGEPSLDDGGAMGPSMGVIGRVVPSRGGGHVFTGWECLLIMVLTS
jgi:hypothetical protein